MREALLYYFYGKPDVRLWAPFYVLAEALYKKDLRSDEMEKAVAACVAEKGPCTKFEKAGVR